jgi:hypothetical protein
LVFADAKITGHQQVVSSHMTDITVYLDVPGTNSALTSGQACIDAVKKAKKAAMDILAPIVTWPRDQNVPRNSPQGEMSCSPTGHVLMEGHIAKQ